MTECPNGCYKTLMTEPKGENCPKLVASGPTDYLSKTFLVRQNLILETPHIIVVTDGDPFQEDQNNSLNIPLTMLERAKGY